MLIVKAVQTCALMNPFIKGDFVLSAFNTHKAYSSPFPPVSTPAQRTVACYALFQQQTRLSEQAKCLIPTADERDPKSGTHSLTHHGNKACLWIWLQALTLGQSKNFPHYRTLATAVLAVTWKRLRVAHWLVVLQKKIPYSSGREALKHM